MFKFENVGYLKSVRTCSARICSTNPDCFSVRLSGTDGDLLDDDVAKREPNND